MIETVNLTFVLFSTSAFTDLNSHQYFTVMKIPMKMNYGFAHLPLLYQSTSILLHNKIYSALMELFHNNFAVLSSMLSFYGKAFECSFFSGFFNV